MYDTIIIGAGIAGLTAAIYSARRELKTLVLTIDIGGQMARVPDIENWPGAKMVNGLDIATNAQRQAEAFGAEFKYGQALKIEKKDKIFIIKTSQEELEAKSIILAFGKVPRSLEIEGEKELVGRGVSYCVNCDGPFFRGKDIAVVGGGNSALDAALYMSSIGNKVYLIHRRDTFRAEEYLVSKAKSLTNIEMCLNDNITKIIGEKKVEKIELKSGKTLEVSAVFIEAGYVVNNSLVEGITDCDNLGQIIVDNRQMTSTKGIFAAGDMTNKHYQQMVIAAGEGATAALSAYEYIQKEF